MKALLILLLSLNVITESHGQATTAPTAKFNFTTLTFHSSICFGTCPGISMNLYKDKRIELHREVFSSKGEIDSTRSGDFKGKLGDKAYKKVIELLQKINWETVSFPDIQCCDGVITTIIISYNGKHKQFKSMTPPESTRELRAYLVELCSKISLPKSGKQIKFEEVNN